MKIKLLTLTDYMGEAEKIKGWMQDICDASHGEFTPAVLAEIISRGTHQGLGWLTDDDELVGVVITTVTNYSSYKCLGIVGAAGAAGGQAGYETAHTVFTTMAKVADCDRFEFRGRRGFAKKFKPLGWKEKYTVYECEVDQTESQENSNDGQNGISRVA